MKKVVIKKELKEVSIDLVSVEKYYGIEEFDNKGFITQAQFESDKFITICTTEITKGNGWPSYNKCKNIHSLISRLIVDDITVYEFDTHKELFKWLSE